MKQLVFLFSVLFVTFLWAEDCPLHNQHQSKETHTSPYAGQENAEYKTLSAEDVTKYTNGEGMGLARAAELNHYPGPKHLLEMSGELKLNDSKQSLIQQTFDEMHQRAVDLGVEILANEKELDALFSGAKATDESVRALTSEIAKLNGELRYVHLSAHLKMKDLLTKDEIAKYESLRGYHHHE